MEHRHGDNLQLKPSWRIYKHWCDQYDLNNLDHKIISYQEIEGNLILDQGIDAFFNLMADVGVISFAKYNQTNAYLGIGTSLATEEGTQTALQGTTITWKKVEPTYPVRGTRKIQWRAVFGDGQAEHQWNEMGLAADQFGNQLFNRKVTVIGEKIAQQTWTLDYVLEVA